MNGFARAGSDASLVLNHLLKRFKSGPPDALANIYLRAGRLFIQGYDRTPVRTAGFWAANGAVTALDATADAVTVGQAVIDTLAQSRLEIPVPEKGAKLDAPLRKAAGVTSERALVAGARVCTVHRYQGEVTVQPTHNGGTSGDARGFSPLAKEHWVRLDALPTADAMGRAVFTALERSTIAPGV